MRSERSWASNAPFVLALTGCAAAQPAQPSIHEPHANVQVRIVHHAELGPMVDEGVLVSGEVVALDEPEGGVRSASMRVRPGAMAYDFHTEFFHTETRVETEAFTVTRNLPCGSHQFGPEYCRYDFQALREVPVVVRVADASCDAHFEQEPLPGAEYLVQYEVVAANDCRVTCQRLVPSGDGGSLATACGEAETSGDERVPAVPPTLARTGVPASGADGSRSSSSGSHALGAPQRPTSVFTGR